jgi:hypothetical protein
VAGVKAIADMRYTKHVSTRGCIEFRVGFASVDIDPKHNAESIAKKYPNLFE